MQRNEFVLFMFVLFSDRYGPDLAHISTFQQQQDNILTFKNLILRFKNLKNLRELSQPQERFAPKFKRN